MKPDEKDVDKTGTELLNNPAGRSDYDSKSVLIAEEQNITIINNAPFDRKKSA